MCFAFRGWRRRYYSCGWPGWFGHRYSGEPEAKDILKRRYAKGEISKEEYDTMMKEISQETGQQKLKYNTMKRRRYNFRDGYEYMCYPFGRFWMQEFFNGNSDALEILRTRYAKGEISYEEFSKMKNDIS